MSFYQMYDLQKNVSPLKSNEINEEIISDYRFILWFGDLENHSQT